MLQFGATKLSWVRLAFLILLTFSLGLKAWRGDAADRPAGLRVESALSDILSAQGFALSEIDGLEGAGWHADRDDCHIHINPVSPMGWHQSVVADLAAGQATVYLFAGRHYDEQPVWLTKANYYWHKLTNYFHPSDLPAVYAVTTSSGCPQQRVDIDLIARNLS